MRISIVGLDVPLLFSPLFIEEVESVIDKNVSDRVSDVALFISRLVKGLQNLSKIEDGVYKYWGEYTYEIEDIGVVHFRPLFDSADGKCIFAIERMDWKFSTSRFFMAFND